MTGEPTYLELGVPDVGAAQRFYTGLLGWQPSGTSEGASVSTPTLDIGLHGGDPLAHFQPFFAVDDLDAALAQVTALGGSRLGEVHDQPGFGRWAELRDDQGVRFGLRETPAG